ncbi:hypothetical protein [Bartonella sp. CM120XJJH]|uniref:hypothetical protein n=1 Tax=Bartonella sp. CM120XJJH TaxID=3243544 RepID=UPI0035CEF065
MSLFVLIGFPIASIFLGGGWRFIVFWYFPLFEGSAVLRHFRSRPFFGSFGDGEYGHTMGTIVLDRDRFCCTVGVVFDFAYEGATRWGGDALFVAIERVGVLRHCWSDLFLFAFGNREYGVGLALVLEGLGVFYHLWIYPSCCLCESKVLRV